MAQKSSSRHDSLAFSQHDTPTVDIPDASWRKSFRRRLFSWYEKHQRDLPWRRSSNVYHVWVSEIMLQQTQVATVEAYFKRFVKKFPTIKSLAAADQRDVLRLWEGLGYYRRARQLHAAAQYIVEHHSGRFPRDVEEVQNLPGIGRYTAGAILSIAFDQRLPILEANTIRLGCRLLGYDGVPTSAAGQKLLWANAESMLPRKNVGTFNQALMELGSLVCKPRTPECLQCPVAALCEARMTGREESLPRPKPRTKFEDVTEAAVVVLRRGRVLLRQCGDDERWAGLWDFPRFAVTADTGIPLRRELVRRVTDLTGVQIEPGERITILRHGVTRFRITLHCYEARYLDDAQSHARNGQVQRWVRIAELGDYPLNTTGRKLSHLVARKCAKLAK